MLAFKLDGTLPHTCSPHIPCCQMYARKGDQAAVGFPACGVMQVLPLEEWHRRLCKSTLVQEVGVLRFDTTEAWSRWACVGWLR